MSKFIVLVISSFTALIVLSGCNGINSQPAPQKVQIVKQTIIQKASVADIAKVVRSERLMEASNMPEKDFVVYGEGIPPMNTISPAQATVLAKRAAVIDAYRQLGEKLFGVRVNAKETVKDAALKDSRIVTQVNGLIKNANITENSYKDGLYTVRMELKMSGARWKEIFSY